MSIDVDRFIRLRSTIRSSITALPKGQEVASGRAYEDAYRRLRPEVYENIPESLRQEFSNVCPESVPVIPSGDVRGSPLLQQAAHANAARSLLEQMAGWLDGLVVVTRQVADGVHGCLASE